MTELKFIIVIDKNIFYFLNQGFEEKYAAYLNALKKNRIGFKTRY